MEQSSNQQLSNLPSVQIGFGNSQSASESQPRFYNSNRNYNNDNPSYRGENQYRNRGPNQTDYRSNDNRNTYGERRQNYNNGDNRGPFRNNNRGNSYRNNYNNEQPPYYQPKQPEDPTYIAKYRIELDLMLQSFPNLTERDSIDLLKRFEQNTAQTVFEYLNELSKENSCKKSNSNSPFFYNTDIFETKDMKYLQDTHEQVLLYYKVFKSTDSNSVQGLPETYYYSNESEKRRPLRKNEEGVYNYLPILCTLRHADTPSKEKCNYAHTDNEINYHSFVYHTKICQKKSDCKALNGLCHFSHGIEEDFRIIYNYQQREICLLMNKLTQKLPKVDPYEKYLQRETYFSLNTFKVSKCLYGRKCQVDYHLCAYYHQESERRRPPALFRYKYEMCKDAKEGISLQFNPQLCQLGDYCPFAHGIYEYYYHEKMFRRLIPCKMEEEKGECPFFETCYKMHNGRNDGYDEEYEKKKRLEGYNSVIQNLKCPLCDKPNPEYTFVLMKCSHLICKQCFKKATQEEKCPICKAEFSKGGNYRIIMDQPFVMTKTKAERKEEDSKEETKNEDSSKKKKRKKKKKQKEPEAEEEDEDANNTFND